MQGLFNRLRIHFPSCYKKLLYFSYFPLQLKHNEVFSLVPFKIWETAWFVSGRFILLFPFLYFSQNVFFIWNLSVLGKCKVWFVVKGFKSIFNFFLLWSTANLIFLFTALLHKFDKAPQKGLSHLFLGHLLWRQDSKKILWMWFGKFFWLYLLIF